MSDDVNALIQRARALIHKAKVMREAARTARDGATATRERLQDAKTLASDLSAQQDVSGVFAPARFQDLPREIWDRLLSFVHPAGDGTLEIADWNGMTNVIIENADRYPALLNIIAVNEARLIHHITQTERHRRGCPDSC